MDDSSLTRTQQTALVLLRTLIGWHFLYEGLVKLVWPAWTRAGVPFGRFSSAGYLRSSTGPFADLFRALADVSWLPWLDLLMAWGYPTFDHLINWRLFKQYSRGHMAELASHMVAITDWFFGATAVTAIGTGGVHRFKDGREVPDHTYVTLEYPGGRTALFTSIESNAFDNYYEAYYGTKGTLILKGEIEAYLFEEGAPGGEARATGVAVAPRAGPAGSASESRSADAAGAGRGVGAASGGGDRLAAYKYEIDGFCGAVRTGAPLKCGPERAEASARACLAGFDAIEKKARIDIKV